MLVSGRVSSGKPCSKDPKPPKKLPEEEPVHITFRFVRLKQEVQPTNHWAADPSVIFFPYKLYQFDSICLVVKKGTRKIMAYDIIHA